MTERRSTIKHLFSTLSNCKSAYGCICNYEVRNLCICDCEIRNHSWKSEICKNSNYNYHVTVNWSMGPNLLSNLLDHWSFQEKLYQLSQYKLMESFLEETSQMRKLVFKHAAEIGCLLLPLSHFSPERPNVVCIEGLHLDTPVTWWNEVSLPGMNHFRLKI